MRLNQVHLSFIFSFLINLTVLSAAERIYAEESVYEGSCLTVPPAENLTDYLTFPLGNRPFTGQFTLGSQSFFHSNARTFLGHPAANEDDIKKMCVTLLYSNRVTCTRLANGMRAFVGVGIIEENTGTISWSTQVGRTPGVHEYPFTETLLWATDDHYLFLRCFNSQSREWGLLSTRRPSREIKRKVLDIIGKLGFNPDLALDAEEFCPPVAPSVGEAAVAALRSFEIFNDSSILFRNLEKPLFDLIEGYSTLGELYLNSLGMFRDIFSKRSLKGRSEQNQLVELTSTATLSVMMQYAVFDAGVAY